MKIVIEDKFLKIIDKEILRTGNVNSYKMSIEYDSFYNDRVLMIYFKQDDIKKIVTVGPDNIIDIPYEVLENVRDICVGFYSPSPDGDKLKDRYCSNFDRLTVIEGAYDKDATPSEELTSTILEKYLQEMKNFYNESLKEYNNNATNKTEEFNKNYEDKIKAYNDNAIQKTNEYNKNADEKIKEINNKVSDVEKIEDNIEEIEKRVSASEQNAKTSETNAKTSESNAQKSAENTSEVLTNVTTIQEDINKSKGEINTAKESVDKSLEKVYSAVTEATNQAKESEKQAGIATSKANQTSADKSAVETMRNEVSSMKTSIEQIKTDTQAIKDDVETAKNETLEAKEEVENSLENERIISDKKYARAIDSDIVEINNYGQVECDNEGYMKDIEIESTLPEITQDTREGYNKFNIDTIAENKYIYANNSNTDPYYGKLNNSNSSNTSDYIPVSENTNYLLTYDYDTLLSGNERGYCFYDENKAPIVIDSIVNTLYSVTNKKATFITPTSAKYLRFSYDKNCNNIQLIEGTEEKPYEEYGATPTLNYPSEFKNILSSFNIKNTVDEIEKYNKSIILPEGKFLGVFKGYKNYIKDNKLYRNLKMIEFDGTEAWIMSNNFFYVQNISDYKRTWDIIGICNYFPVQGNVGAGADIKDNHVSFFGGTNAGTGISRIYVQCSYFEGNLDNFKTWLAEKYAEGNPLKICYMLENEEETSLEDINLALYQGINNISSEDLKLNFKYNVSIEKYIEENNANERRISDSKYARALKTQVEDIEQIQVYADNSEVENLIIKGAQLTQVVTEQSENIILLEDYPTTNNNGIDVTIKDNKITLNGTATAAFNLRLPIKYISKKSITGDWCLGYISSGDLSSGNGNIQVYGSNNQNIQIYFPKSSNPLINYTKKTFDNVELNTSHINIYMNNSAVADNIVIDFTLANVSNLEAGIPFTPNSPSLDFPSEIKVANEQKILICRKNLIKSFKFDDSNLNNYGWILRIEAPIKPNTTYTIGIKCSKDNKYYLSEEWIVGGGTNFTVTMTGNMQYITFTTKSEFNKAAYNSSQGGYILLKNRINQPNAHIFEDIILVEGTVNEAYQPYEGQDISIPLQNLAIGDYSDVIDKDKAIQNKLVQEIIFDGTENWIVGTEKEKTKVFHININMVAVSGIGICNYLPYKSNVDEELISYAGNAIYIAINKTRLSNAEELKALLAQLYQLGKPMKLYLVRQDAIKISLSEEVKQELDKFKLYNDLNNVFIDNGSLSFKYNKSLLRAFEEQSELSANLLERVQALEQAQVNQVGGN